MGFLEELTAVAGLSSSAAPSFRMFAASSPCPLSSARGEFQRAGGQDNGVVWRALPWSSSPLQHALRDELNRAGLRPDDVALHVLLNALTPLVDDPEVVPLAVGNVAASSVDNVPFDDLVGLVTGVVAFDPMLDAGDA